MESRERPADWGTARVSAGLSRRVFINRMAGLVTLTVLGDSCGAVAGTPSKTTHKYRIGHLSLRTAACVDPSEWHVTEGAAVRIGRPAQPNTACADTLLIDALAQRGYRVGENVELIMASPAVIDASGHPQLFAQPVARLIELNVDVIVTSGGQAALAAKQATTTTPIVMQRLGLNAIEELGLVPSLSRPGGNITGAVLPGGEVEGGKRLELLKESFPWVRRPILAYGTGSVQLRAAQIVSSIAGELGLSTTPIEWTEGPDLMPKAQAALNNGADSIVLLAPVLSRPTLQHLVRQHRLPHVGDGLGFAEHGYLVATGSGGSISPTTADYVDRILGGGAKPGDLPITQLTNYDIYINLKAASELGVQIAPSVIARATRVVR